MNFFTKNLLLVTLCLIARIGILNAQNLVVNPSFELTNTNCGNFGGEGFRQDLNPSWDNANSNTAGDSCSSPDLFSACNFAFTAMPGGGFGSLGYQYSHTGTRHTGLITYDATSSTYREYIQGHTTTPLVAGQVYCVSMYVSLPNTMPYATNNIGVYFTNTGYYRDACAAGALISVTPQLNTSCVITDTTANWTRLQWNYTAVGGEKYFVIGNFFNNAGTTKVNTGQAAFPNPFAYYFIDDVAIIPNSCCYADIVHVGPLCSNSTAAITMTATTGLGAACSSTISGGTWSGLGITNATTGVFSPSVAGVGVHTVSLSLTCGYTATTSITVSPCNLTVCHTGSVLTVSGGTPSYTWQAQTTFTNCSACPGGNCIPFICAGVITTTWTTVASNTNTYTASTFPIKVFDSSGSTFTITSLGTIPTCTVTASCPTLTMAITSQTNVNCFGTNTGSATVNTSGGTGPYTYTWSPGNLNGASQTGLVAGTYTIAIKDANLCPGVGNVTITQPTAVLSAVISATSTTGCGASTGGATVTVSGGTSSYTYLWNPSAGTTAGVSNLGSGNNTVTVTDSKGCTSTVVANITTAGGPTLAVVSQTNVNCFGASTGTATVNGSGGTGPYTYTWTPGNLTGASQTSLSAGVYTINVSDANSCTGSGTLSINQPTSALNAVITTTTAAGCGSSTSTAVFWTENFGVGCSQNQIANGANPSINGAWAVTNTGTNDPDANQWFISATESGMGVGNCGDGCLGAGTTNRTLHISSVPTSPAAFIFCPTGDCGAAYDAGFGANNVTADKRAESPTINCTGQSSITINFNYIEGGATTIDDATLWYFDGTTWTQIDNMPKTVVCGGGQGQWSARSLVLPASANNNPNVKIGYRWVNNDDGVGTDPSFAVDDITLSSTTSGSAGGGATVTASGGTPGYNYNWMPSGVTTAGATGLAAGTHTVIVSDSKGCSTTTGANIISTGGPTLTVVSQLNVNCFATTTGTASVNGTGGTGPYTYTWSPGNLNGNSQTALSAGVYTINVQDANQCLGSNTLSISQPTAALNAVVSNTTASGCGTSTGGATVTVSGGTPSYTYLWNPSGGTTAGVSNLASGNNTLIVTDSKGCTSTAVANITSAGGPTLAITSQTNVKCLGVNTGTATVNATGGTSPYSYTWSPGNLNGASQTSLSAGTYTINVSDANSCAGTGTLVITQPTAALSVSISNSPTGCGTSVGSATANASGGTLSYNYTWSAPIIAIGNVASNLAAGTYSVLVTDNNGCQASAVTVITSGGSGPILSIASQTNVLCNAGTTGGASINASGATAPYSYTWLPAGGNASSASGLTAGVYTITVSDASVCTSTISVSISQPAIITSSLNVFDASCGSSDGSATINAAGGTGALTILWQTGSTNNSISGLAPGSYSVVITDANNCTAMANAVIGTSGGLAVDAGPGSTILGGESTQLSATVPAGATVSWSPPESLGCPTCPITSASPIVTTTYTITADLGGCIGWDTVTVMVDILCGDLYIPTAFSPNGDGQNDILYVMGNCITNLQFAIFDRWGEKVFETTDPAIGWDGTFNGKKLDPAGFAYYLKATVKGEDLSKKGNISIVK